MYRNGNYKMTQQLIHQQIAHKTLCPNTVCNNQPLDKEDKDTLTQMSPLTNREENVNARDMRTEKQDVPIIKPLGILQIQNLRI